MKSADERYIEKIAFLEHVLPHIAIASAVATGLHVGGNALVKGVMHNAKAGKWMGKELGRTFARGMRGDNPTLVDYASHALAGPIPELAMMQQHTRKIGEESVNTILDNVQKAKEQKFDLHSIFEALEHNDVRYLAKQAQRYANSAEAHPAVRGMRPFINMLASDVDEHSRLAHAILKNTTRNDPILKNILPGVAEGFKKENMTSMRDVVKAARDREFRHESPLSLRRVIKGASILGTTAIEPIAGIASGIKVLSASEHLPKQFHAAQKASNDFFAVNPTVDMAKKGKFGINIVHRKIKEVADSLLMNPVISYVKNAAYDINKMNNIANQFGYK